MSLYPESVIIIIITLLTLGIQMKSKAGQLFLIFTLLLLLCSHLVLAEDVVQNKNDIISIIGHERHQSDIVGTAKIYFSKLLFNGEVLISKVSYQINHRNSVLMEDDTVTTQADLDFWDNLQDQYPFSEKPVFISVKSICGPVNDYVPDGVSEVSVTDNSEKQLASYTITKKERGFTLQKGYSSNPDHVFTITLNKLEELEEVYGNVGQVQACKKYIKSQIQNQA